MLRVCEIYSAAQGEGMFSLGLPSIFVRMSGCNLQCLWCDSYYTWNFIGTKFKGEEKFKFPKANKKEEVHYYSAEKLYSVVVDLLKANSINNVVLTGGEPLLQQKNLYPALSPLKDLGCTFEVETNGTVLLSTKMFAFLDRINCSIKLENSGNSIKRRLKEKVVEQIVNHPGASFKFVVFCEEELEEILSIVEKLKISKERVCLMYEGKTRENQIAGQCIVQQMAKKSGYAVSPRLHVLEFGEMRGV